MLDIEVLQCLAEEIDADGVRAALAVFLKDTPDCFALLRRLSCTRDRARIKDEAHQLKGAAETFGLCQFAELAKTLEFCAPTITPPDFTALLDRLEASFARAREEAAAVVETCAFAIADVTPSQFRRIALSLPGASEGTHMGTADFRVGNKIFATLGNPDAASA